MPKMRSYFLVFFMVAWPALAHPQVFTSTDSIAKILAVHQQHDTFRVKLLNQQAYNFYLASPEKALDYAFEAKTISQEISYPRGEGQAHRQMGLVSWAQGIYPSALKNLLEGLRLAEIGNDAQLVADITGNIGLVYLSLQDYEQAFTYHNRSLEMQRKLKNRDRESVALNNIGDIKRAQKEYAKAIEYYQLALQIRRETNNANGQAVNIRNIGNVYEAEGKFDLALKNYFVSMRMADSLNEKRGMSQARLAIASTYLKKRNFKLAKEYAKASLAISEEALFRTYIRDTYMILSQISEGEKNINEAFRYFKLYSTYKDSVVNLQVGSEIAAHRLDYEGRKKQAEIDLLKKDALLQESIIEKKNTLLVSIGITLALLALLSVALFQNFSRQKNINRVLSVKNGEIEKQRSEIAEQRDELIALNEEIRAQQEEVTASRDSLAEKNEAIAEMNQRIMEINESLEQTVLDRTAELEKQHQQMIEYAFINAHKLRAPLARILGLTNLLQITSDPEEQQKLMDLLFQSSNELDDVVRIISGVLQEGLEVYEKREMK
ncbi:MAG: tetratricopeptide repeat protein [Bacteroidota bacterium]